MKKIFTLLALTAAAAFSQKALAQQTIRVYDTVLFYGGYGDTTAFQEPAPPGVVRLKTSLFTKKLTPDVLNQIGHSLDMKVYVKASCDNYDRAGHVSLAFAPKGSDRYSISDTAVKRLEIARFITPFMDKNKMPNTVPYEYQIDNVASILKENSITDNYDIWMELEIFGVASAAQTQIAGCSGRFDVFYGTVDLITDASAPRENDNIIVPMGNQLKFNNYQAAGTDAIGTTEKTLTFTLNNTSYNTNLYLITSNHGAGNNGEEYNRRNHFVYFDGTQVLQYKPGFPSCEPYRIYNTQRNGIYNPGPNGGVNYLSDAQWQSFSNWCPGAYVPIRVINVGDLAAGTHTFKISVPDAVFPGGDGNFPLSLYVQGKSVKPTSIQDVDQIAAATDIFPNPAATQVSIRSAGKVSEVRVFNVLGQEIYKGNDKSIAVTGMQNGVYYVKIKLENNIIVTKSFIKH